MHRDDSTEKERRRLSPDSTPAAGPRCRHHGFGLDAEPPGARSATRRDFLKGTVLGAAALMAGPRLLGRTARAGRPGGPRLTKVVRAFHPDATTGWTTVNQEPVDLMVQAAIKELTGIGNVGEAWKSLFPGIDATKKIAIKINLACGDVPTHPEVINAVIDGLLAMDLGGQTLPEEQIIVWDLDNPFFCPQTGYTPNWGGPGVQYVGTDHPSLGHDTTVTVDVQHPLGVTTHHHPSKIITQHCDYLINAAVIKDHNDSGVTLTMKNHYGSFDGIGVYPTHQSGTYGDGHARTEPALNAALRDQLGDKTALWLIDGTFGFYMGGPGYIPGYPSPPNWAYNSVIVGTDPVSVDRVGTMKINDERRAHGLGELDPSHVAAAAGDPWYLGTDDPGEIDLVEVDASDLTAAPLAAPGGVALLAPYPNPTRGACTLRLSCARDIDAELSVVDARGRLVRRLAARRFAGGTHRLLWDGRGEDGRALASGVYFARVRHAGGERRQRVVLVR